MFDVYRRLYLWPPSTSSDTELMRRRQRPLDWCVHIQTHLFIKVSVSVFLMLLMFQSSFIGAIAIGDLVKSTLGPKGMVRNAVITITDQTVCVRAC